MGVLYGDKFTPLDGVRRGDSIKELEGGNTNFLGVTGLNALEACGCERFLEGVRNISSSPVSFEFSSPLKRVSPVLLKATMGGGSKFDL